MAVVNYYDSIIGEVSCTEEVVGGTNLKDLTEKYINEKNEEAILIEVYNADTDITEYEAIVPESYKVITMINGEEVPMSSEIADDDVVSILFVPQSKEAGGVLSVIAGVTLALVGAALMAVSGVTSAALLGWGLGLIIGGAALTVLGFALLGDENQNSYEDKDSNKNLPYISGAENETQLNNRYLYVMGKHLVTPRIVGSPYHKTKTKNRASAEDLGQEVHILYDTGYGPVKITDIKMGEEILAYNRSSASGDRKTIYHGQLSGCDNPDEGVIGDIPVKWKNNDVKLEILQAGSKVNESNRYGNIYPQVVLEKQINANCLFVYDKIIEEIAGEKYSRTYYNRAVPVGYRNNGVRYSSSCPMKLEVELDFSNGLYATRQVKSGKSFENRYYNIPLNVAVQWRFTGRNVDSSNAEKSTGWNDFSYIHFEEEDIPPSVYTIDDVENEIKSNKGLTPDIVPDQQAYTKHYVDNAYDDYLDHPENYPEFAGMTESQIKAVLNERAQAAWLPYYQEAKSHYPNPGWVGTPVFKLNTENLSNPHKADDFNTMERRYVFTYNFTEEECRKLAGFSGGENILDVVEVRVIRISPCYLSQESADDSNNNTAYSYQDLFKWTYLRTYTFDKVKYLQALNDATDPSTVSVNNFTERPQPIESDTDKFCYLALQATEDVANTIGGSIKKVSCIAESFTPKYDIIKDKWYPENLWEEYKYYEKYKVGNDYKTKEITKDEYIAGVVNDQELFIKQAKGNDFIEQVRDEIFVDANIIPDSEGIVKYSIPESISNKYISSNTAAQFVHAIVGPQLGIDSRTYDNIQMDATTEFYKFCEDVTDGTKEDYIGINPKLVSQIDSCNSKRLHTKSEITSAGYNITDDYCVDCAEVWSNKDGTEAIVVTPIRNKKTEFTNGIIPAADFNADTTTSMKYKYQNKSDDFDTSIIMAKFTGENSAVSAGRYIKIHKILMDIIFNPSKLDNEWIKETNNCFEILKDITINALRSGLHIDIIKALNESLCKFANITTDPIYESYIIDILEQTVQEGQSKSLCKEADELLHVKFECNGVIDKEVKLETLLQKILLTGRTSLKRSDENKFEPLIGRPNPYPVTVLNQRNCISKSNTRSYEEGPSGFLVSCIDESDNYTSVDFYVMAKGEDYRNPLSRIETFSIDYVTNKWQLALLTRFNLAAKIYQIEAYTRTVGILGYALTLGDTVLLQDDSLLIGTDRGGRIMQLIEDDNYIYGFVTDEPFDYTGEVDGDGRSVQGCTVIQPQKFKASRCVTYRFAAPDQIVNTDNNSYTMTVGLTNKCLFEVAIQKNRDYDGDIDSEYIEYAPKMDNVVAFGLVGNITSKAVVMGIKASEKEQFTISLAPYNEDVYNSGFGQPVFKSNMTINAMEENFEFNDNVTKRTIADEVDNFTGSAISEIKGDLKLDEAPDTFTATAIAREDGLKLSVNFTDSTTLNNSVQSVSWEVLYVGEDNEYHLLDTYETTVAESIYTFDRSFIGYPEKDSDTYVKVKEQGELVQKTIPAINKWRVRAKVTNVYGVQSESWCAEVTVNTDGYGTWKFNEAPSLSHRVSDRTISLMCSVNRTSVTQYGNTRFKIKIRRCEPLFESETEYPYDPVGTFFIPDLKTDPYPVKRKVGDTEELIDDRINSYKLLSGDDVIVSAVHIQTVPLWGQGYNDIHNTEYEFQVIAFNESGNESEPAYENATALCTSIRDIVEANLDVKTQYVENLTALSSAFGFVSGGANSDEQWANLLNYWALNDKVISYSGGTDNINRVGAFRVGGTEQYLKVVPQLDPDNPDGPPIDYKLELNVGDFSLSSNETRFNNGLLVYDKDNPNIRLEITHEGIFFEKKNEDGEWPPLAKMIADTNGNMTITNAEDDDPTLPKYKVLLGNTKIYHFETNTLDEDGDNSGNFNFVPYDSDNQFADISPIPSQKKSYNGVISKEIEEETLCFFNSGDKIKVGTKVINTNDLTTDNTCTLLNECLGTSAFRWEE